MRYKIVCKICGKNFEVIEARRHTAKYCSPSCRAKGNFGEKGYWYGKKRSDKFKKNQSIAQKKRFKWDTPWNKGKSLIGVFSDEKIWNWKGNEVGNKALHSWIRRRLKKPKKCELCKKDGRVELSNKDHKYKRDLKNWQWICSKCHKKYDGMYGERWSKLMKKAKNKK